MIMPARKPGAPRRPAFSFVDLFAGIGGMRLAFEQVDGHCVFTVEQDRFARQTYQANHAGCELASDIRTVPAPAIPPHDVLLAGFPCQPFTLCGIGTRNWLGRKHGFADRTQGTLFFDIVRILAHHRPRAFLLENVRNLLHHDGGRTIETIRRTLADDLGYQVQWRVLNATGLVPQNRTRVFIIGVRDPCGLDFDTFRIRYPRRAPVLRDILEPDAMIGETYTLSDRGVAYIRRRAIVHKARGNGFQIHQLGPDAIMPTLMASYCSGRQFVINRPGRNPRAISPRECARAMGFPDSFVIPVSKTQAYRQFGNSVVVPLVAQVAAFMRPCLTDATTARSRRAPIPRPDRPRPGRPRPGRPHRDRDVIPAVAGDDVRQPDCIGT